MEGIKIEVPQEIENLALPNPALLDYYKDADKRIFWLEGEVDSSTLELVKVIMRFNKDDEGKPVEERTPLRIFIDTCGGDVQIM